MPVWAKVGRDETISVHSYVTGEAVQFINLDQRVLTLRCTERDGGMYTETFTATTDGLALISTTIDTALTSRAFTSSLTSRSLANSRLRTETRYTGRGAVRATRMEIHPEPPVTARTYFVVRRSLQLMV